MTGYSSWGLPLGGNQSASRPSWCPADSYDLTPDSGISTLLAFGNGRSYGDSCMNCPGTIIDCRSLNRFVYFDSVNGQLTIECGVLFNDIINQFLPKGWFLPVTPGTRFVTVGGAIANDVHGKNHHRRGTLGQHIVNLQLLRSNGELLNCSNVENSDLFNATIGGLGLTGLITTATIQLMPVQSATMDTLTLPFNSVEEFVSLSRQYDESHEYSVAWLDCLNTSATSMRGLLYCANHSSASDSYDMSSFRLTKPRLSIPCHMPSFTLNRYSVALFNQLYYRAGKRKTGKSTQSLQSFFYPLDGLNHWNRIYGKDGFFQYQFTVPESQTAAFQRILDMLAKEASPSFLTVLKLFGNKESPGMLSFPQPGLCLALDLSHRGEKTLQLLDRLDQEVIHAGGSVYPAKDRRMSAEAFRTFFPRLDEFNRYVDPSFCSDFWRRVTDQ